MEKEIHFASVAVVLNNNHQILLAQRNQPDSIFHEFWNLPGGGVEFGEEPKETVKREVREETGIEIALVKNHPYVFSWIHPEHEYQIIIMAFPAKQIGGVIDFSNDDETKDAKWFRYEEIDFTHSLPLMKEMIDETIKDLALE